MVVPVRLFDDNPPSDDAQLVNSLFVDRDFERGEALAMMRSAVAELGGVAHKPLAISGNARLGKSHLLWHLVTQPEVIDMFDLVVRVPLRPGPQDVRNAMAMITMSIVTALDNYALHHGLIDGFGNSSTAWAAELCASLEPIITGEVESITVSKDESWTRTIGSKLGTDLPSFLKAVVPMSAERERTNSQTRSQAQSVVLRPLSIESLSELARVAHHRASGITSGLADKPLKMLVVLDDFDLMHRDASGAYDPGPLLKGIALLCDEPGLHVLTTVRQDTYVEQDKVFTLLCEVREFDNDAILIELFERHIQHFNDGSDVLRGAVEQIARQSNGRVGVFLKTLRELHIVRRRSNLLSDADLFADWKQTEWTRAKALDPIRAGIVERAIASRGGRLDSGELDQLRGSELFRFVLEDFTSHDSASVNPLWMNHLREREINP